MFLFALTRQSIAARIHMRSVQEFPEAPFVITAATDESLSRCLAGPDRVTVTEAPPFTGDASRVGDGGDRDDEGLVFARAAYSRQDKAVEITRTLIGGRQVYYHTTPGGDFYCSSHVYLLRDAGVRLEEDPERLPEMLVYRYVTPPRTLFKNIDQLLAGQRLQFRFDGQAWRQADSALYCPPRPDPTPRAAADGNGSAARAYSRYGDQTRDALRDAILALAPGKDRLHVLASGGLDSSILFKLAQSDLGVTQGYSTGYPFESEEDDVEKRYALTAAEAFGARHRFFAPTVRDFQRGFLEAVSVGEEPIVHTQSILMLLLFRDGLPPGEATAVVGQGADGVFGMRLHRIIGRVERFKSRHPRLAAASGPAVSVLRPLLGLPPVALAVRRGMTLLRRDSGVLDLAGQRWGAGTALSDPANVLWRLGVTGSEALARRRFGVGQGQIFAGRAAAVAPYADRDVLDTLSLLDFLSDVSVTQGLWSKFGEAAGKTVYYPFNARGLLDSAFATPWEAKLAEPKGVLRDAARKLGIPEFIVSRPKANFNASSNRWALPGGVFEPFIPLAAKVLDVGELRRIQARRTNAAFTFWALLNYAIWKRLFINNEPLDRLMEELERSTAESG